MAPKYPSIPEPTNDPLSLRDAVLAIKQFLEILTGQRGSGDNAALLPSDLSNAQDAINADVATKVSKSGDTMTGNLAITAADPFLILNKTSAATAHAVNILGTTNTLPRWNMQLGDGSIESGSNAGSNFALYRYDDAGTYTSTPPLTIARNTGNATFYGTTTLQNSTLGFSLTLKDSTSGAHKDFRVNAGTLEIINQANTLVIASVTDAGVFNTVGDINAGNNIISKSVVSTYGDLQTRALNSGGDASLTFYNESAAQKGRLYWSHSGHIFLSNSAALVPFVLTDSSVVQASGGILGRSGVSGGYSANIYNFQYSTIFEAWVNNTFLGQVAFVSDYRTKKDVIDLPAMWDTVKKLRPIKYTQQEFSPPSHLEYISQRRQRDAKMVAQDKAYTPEKIPGPLFTADDTERWGFMAHELQETLVMSAATGAKDAAAAIQSPNPLTIIAALTKALQETMTRVEALEAKP